MAKAFFAAISIALAGMLSLPGHAATVTYDFEEFARGDVIADLTLGPLTGRAFARGGVGALVAFDTVRPTGRDYDLAGPIQDTSGAPKDFGKVMIIQENNKRFRNGRFKPDDNAGGGVMTFIFDQRVRFHGVDIIDVEEPGVDVFLDGVRIAEGVGRSADHRYAAFQYSDPVYGHELKFVFQGSGAIDNLIVSNVPLPPTALLMLTGLGALGVGARLRRA